MVTQTEQQPLTPGADHGSNSATAAPEDPLRRGLRERLTNPSLVAIVVWLVGAPAAFVLPSALDMDPFFPRAWSLAIGLALVAAAVGLGITARWTAAPLAGAATGLLSVWVLFTLRMALNGTPYGFAGLQGDTGRLAAGATDFAYSLGGSGYWIPNQPREYPPLYLMIVGKVADLAGEPGWRLLADAEVIGASLAVLACFLMWRRLMPAWVSFAISAVMLVSYFDARKPYEVIALYVIVPWALATFGRPPRGRLHWLTAGLIGALIVLTYQGWLVFGSLGIVALIVINWRSERERRKSYVLRLVGVFVVALVVTGWYVLPYVYALLTVENKMISDMYAFPSMLDIVFPFAENTPIALLQLIGLIGLLWLRRTTWWATPMLLLAASAFLYRALMMVSFARSGHTAFAHYAVEMVIVVLAAAGVLVLVHTVPLAVKRLGGAPPRGTVAALTAIAVGWMAWSFTMEWMPGTRHSSVYTLWAHQEPLPDGGYSSHARPEGRIAWFPVGPIERAVEGVLGENPRKVTLSADDRLYSFVPWPGYMTTSRFGSGTFALFDSRLAELRRLEATGDPAAFARESAQTRFGPIDVFILQKRDGAWQWRGLNFRESQFDTAQWTIIDNLPENVVVAIRR
jgi:hypothetical protein